MNSAHGSCRLRSWATPSVTSGTRGVPGAGAVSDGALYPNAYTPVAEAIPPGDFAYASTRCPPAVPPTVTVFASVLAVICVNDMMAIGLLQAARKQGLEVPRDLSIIGFDDIFGSDFTCPPLTTIRVPATHLGELAVRRLLSIIEGTEPPSDDDAPATSLIVRESTGRPRSR